MGAGHTSGLYVDGRSRVHRMSPESKLVGGIGFVLVVATTPREVMWPVAVYALALMVVFVVAGLRPARVIPRMAVILPFAAFAVFLPFIAGGEHTNVLGISVSVSGLWSTWNIFTKALIGVSISILLASTTRVPDLLSGLSRLRVPRAFTAIAGFMFRYLDLVTEELGRMRTAMVARAYDPRWLWQARPIATSAGALFVRTYERGERVHAAMVSRGFTGEMPELRARQGQRSDWALTAGFVGVALAATITARLAA